MNATIDKRKLMVPAALISVLVMVLASVAVMADDSDATGDNLTGYGTVNEVTLGPGYTWSYTATFPSDLTEGIVLSFQTNEMGSTATIDKHTVKIGKIPASMAGNKYNLVLKAVHADSSQTTYQWIRITVNQALTVSSSGVTPSIIKGASEDITLTSSGGIGTTTWKSVTMPEGLSLSGNRITGIPTTVGANTIKVTATNQMETKDLTITFTVYSKIAGGDTETITAIAGKQVSSTAITNASDLGVKWKVTSGTLPAGMNIDADTGVVSGAYTGATSGSAALTLTGTAANGPAQTATKSLTINYEPGITISGGTTTIVTYTGNTEAKTTTLTVPGDHSGITWSIPETTGITIGSTTGILSIAGTAAVTADGSIVVTATTANGGSATKTVKYIVEDTLKIAGDKVLSTTAGKAANIVLTVTGGYTNTASLNSGGYGDAVTFDQSTGKLTVTNPTSHAKETVTLTVTSAGGQTATHTVDVTVYSSIGFNSLPSAGIIGYAG